MLRMASILKKPVKLALVQLAAGADKNANLQRAREKVVEASENGANIVVLPECFNSPYGTQFFPKYAETLFSDPDPASKDPTTLPPPSEEASPSFHALAALAKETKVYLIAGSIPERSEAPTDGKEETLYNTSLTFSPSGSLLAVHRKVHLFDISIPGKITFRESDSLSPGKHATIIDLPEYGKVGIAICYDVRFPELAMIAARKGAFALIYPGAFNTTTGPMHWSLLARARAVDNQCYVALCSPARDMNASYHAWGHSMVVDPNANILGEAEDSETTIYAELSNDEIENARKGIPVTTQRRFDVYPDVSK